MRIQDLNLWTKLLLLVLVLVALYFPFFLHLDSLPFQQYDESLFAFRAYHIAEHGTPLKNFGIYDQVWEFPNSKPPLFSYIQALSFKIFGYNELAIRLPVAISGVLSCLSLIFISIKRFNDLLAGIFSAIILATSIGFIGKHMGRFGDQDVPFALFTFLFVYQFYQFLKTHRVRPLVLAALFFLISFMIKSIAVFLVLPGVFLFTVFQKESLGFFRTNLKVLTLLLLLVSLTIGGLAIFDLDQFYAVIENYKRFTTKIDPYHSHGFWFYVETFINKGLFTPWIFLLPLSTLPIIFNSKWRDFLIYLWSIILLDWLFISLAQVKIAHYAAPIYILASFSIGISISWCFRKLFTLKKPSRNIAIVALALILLILFTYQYQYIITNIATGTEKDYKQSLSCLLKRRTEFQKGTVIYSEKNLSNAFYLNIRNHEQGYSLRRTKKFDNKIEIQSAVYACEWEDITKLSETFNIDTIDAKFNCGVFWVKSRKDSSNILQQAEID